jgi:Domain of unknown function (DU1801)
MNFAAREKPEGHPRVRKMAEIKTKRTEASPADFLNAIKDKQACADCWTIAKIMQAATKSKPKMWGPSIVGFGSCRYKYPDGREMDWMLIALSPRKAYISVYAHPSYPGRSELMARLGKCSAGKSCINIKRLSEIDLPTLKKIIDKSVAAMRKDYPS